MLNYIFSSVIFLSISGGIAALAALAVCLAGKRLSPLMKYYIWLIPMLAFLVAAPRLTINVPEVTETERVEAEAASESEAYKQLISEPTDDAQAAPATTPANLNYSGYTPTKPKTDYTQILAAAYFLIAAVLLVRIPVSRLMFSAKMRRLSTENETLSQEYGVRIREFFGSGTPFVTGAFRATVYIPEHRSGDDALMLLHELTHVKRRDLLYKLAADIICAIHFFNPTVYLMKKFIDRYCELSCDEAATKKLSAEERGEYARMILSFASAQNLPRFAAALTEGGKNVKERIVYVMKPRNKSIFMAAISVLLVSALAFGTAVMAAEVNGRNTVSAPRLSYVGKFSGCNGNDSEARYLIEYDRSVDNYAYFSNVLGRTVFHTAYKALDREMYAEYMELNMRWDYIGKEGEDRIYELIDEMDKSENYIHNVEIELTKLTRSYGGICYEGDFIVRIDGEEKTVKGRLTNMPPCSEYLTEQPELELYIDGNVISLNFDFDCRDNSAINRANTERRYYLDKNWLSDGGGTTTRIDYIVKLDGESEYSNNISYNRDMNAAWASFPIDKGRTLYMYIPDEIGENEIKGEMVLFDYREDTVLPGITDILDGTISNINGKPGEMLTVSAGDITVSYEITEFEVPKTNGRGTREISEFDFGDEPVFIGTPFEQDEFDKIHRGDGTLYNRIVVDDYGKVMYIAPILWQTAPTYYISDSEAYSGANSWSALGNSVVITVDGTKRERKWMLWDSVRQEIVVTIPPEYQFMTE